MCTFSMKSRLKRGSRSPDCGGRTPSPGTHRGRAPWPLIGPSLRAAEAHAERRCGAEPRLTRSAAPEVREARDGAPKSGPPLLHHHPPSMRRLALVLLPCAVAFLVHLWAARRPLSAPPDARTLPGTPAATSAPPRARVHVLRGSCVSCAWF